MAQHDVEPKWHQTEVSRHMNLVLCKVATNAMLVITTAVDREHRREHDHVDSQVPGPRT